MLKGIYTFPDKTKVDVYYNPSKSDENSVYVEWYKDSLKYTMWLPPQGLIYKK